MSKAKSIGLLVVGITICYIVLAIFINFVADTSVSVNQTLAASSNLSLYPGLSGFLLSTPWILYVAPAVLGIIILVVILKRKEGNI